MEGMKPSSLLSLSALALIGWQASVRPLFAVTNTFTIDPQRSSIVLSGNVSGNALNPQGPGSLSNLLTGTLLLDVTPSTLRFTGGSLIDTTPNGNWAPLPGGGAGTAPADFAGTVSIIIVTAQAAVRNVLLDVTSPILPLTAGSFDASGMLFQFLTNSSGSLDYRVSGFAATSGSRLLDGLSTNGVITGASLTSSGGTLTLVLPVNATSTLTLISPNDTTLRLQGQLVATAPAGDVPLVVSVRVEGTQIILEWPSSAGQNFSVETTQDFSAWIPASGTTVAGSNTTTWTSSLGAGSQFYRVVRSP